MSSGSVDDMTPVDDDTDDELAPGSSVPVGITIAYKRQEQGFNEEKMLHTTHTSSSSKKKKPNSSTKKKKKMEESQRKSKSFQVLLESAAIYATCLILPTILAFLYNWYDAWKYERETGTVLPEEESLWHAYVVSSPNYQYFLDSVYKPLSDHACVAAGSESSYTWSLFASMMERTGICPGVLNENAKRKRSVLSDDVAAYTDVFTIAVCSFFLAFIRLAIIRCTVPINDADTLEALVRNKSVHLLSSDYVVTPTATPLTKPRKTKRLPEAAKIPFMVPDLHDAAGTNQDDYDNNELFGFNIDATTDREEDPFLRFHPFATGAPVSTDAVVSVHTKKLGRVVERESVAADRTSLMPNLPSMTGMDGFDTALLLSLAVSEDEPVAEHRDRIYAAPRYATALFRLAYSTAAAAIALYYFRDADFWPWFVSGHGQTAKCWDLSGGLTVGMDSDFDQRNAVLKRYFLLQASYHWHSGAFHVLSLLTLILHPTKHAPRRFVSFRKGSDAYVRSLAQHILSVGLIAVAYIFSSLRRLGAIGLFAFDVSSWFLHLLQVCINAPEDSRWRRHEYISRIYWGLVIPSFVVTRFGIWPAIWYSATFESSQWLTQLEKTLWLGSAALLRNVFHLLMVILHALSVIYFRRLLNHSHLKRILRQSDDPFAVARKNAPPFQMS